MIESTYEFNPLCPSSLRANDGAHYEDVSVSAEALSCGVYAAPGCTSSVFNNINLSVLTEVNHQSSQTKETPPTAHL